VVTTEMLEHDFDETLGGIAIDKIGDILLTNIDNFASGTETSGILRIALPIVGTQTATIDSISRRPPSNSQRHYNCRGDYYCSRTHYLCINGNRDNSFWWRILEGEILG